MLNSSPDNLGLPSSSLKTGKTTDQHEEVAEFPAEFKQLRLQVNKNLRNQNYLLFRQHNFKDTKSKKTGFKMFFRPDELLKAYQDGNKTHNYKIAKVKLTFGCLDNKLIF